MSRSTKSSTSFPPRGHGSILVAKAFEDGGKHLTALSGTFLLACLYILVGVSSVEHRSLLLLGDVLQLPLLSVSISLVGFFLVAPALLVVLHVNLLIQNRVLTARLLDRQRIKLGGSESLLLFPSLPFLANSWPDHWSVRILVAGALVFTNALLPLAVLCYTEYKFLPAHLLVPTCIHFTLILADISLLWLFFVHRGRRSRTRMVVIGLLALAFAFALVTFISLFLLRAVGFPERNLNLSGEVLIKEVPPPEVLAVAVQKGVSRADWLLEQASGAKLDRRNLRYARLIECTLTKADLRGADLGGALLAGSDLRHADFSPYVDDAMADYTAKKLREPSSRIGSLDGESANLESASLEEANLSGARLVLAKLKGVNLRRAHLIGADLTGADLRDAHLEGAVLTGAKLDGAKLDNAVLIETDLSGASLVNASIVGTSLYRARAVRASFAGARITGATFAESILAGSDFVDAAVTACDFRRANLYGVKALSLNAAELRGARLGGGCRLDMASLIDLRGYSRLSTLVWVWGRPLETMPGEGEEYLCLGLSQNSPEHRGLLFDARKQGPFSKWDPRINQWREGAEVDGVVWGESEFYRQLAEALLAEACSADGLELVVFRRAAGEQNPGNLSFDLELARQLIGQLDDGKACPNLRLLGEDQKRRIRWRLRKAEREQYGIDTEVLGQFNVP